MLQYTGGGLRKVSQDKVGSDLDPRLSDTRSRSSYMQVTQSIEQLVSVILSLPRSQWKSWLWAWMDDAMMI